MTPPTFVLTTRIAEVVIGIGALAGAWFSHRSGRGGRSAYTWGYLLMGLAFLGFSVSHCFLLSGHKATYGSVMTGAKIVGASATVLLVVALVSDLQTKMKSGGQT
jgi:hypothetical protein